MGQHCGRLDNNSSNICSTPRVWWDNIDFDLLVCEEGLIYATVTAYFSSHQLLLFVCQYACLSLAVMPVFDGRRESHSSKTNSSNCSLEKKAETAVCLCTALSTRWQKRILQPKINSSNYCLLEKYCFLT